MPAVICPECGAAIDIDAKTEEGEMIQCPECSTELEVVRKGKKFDVELVESGGEKDPELGESEFEEYD
jgi:lysine biosynthesis protein LysW